MRKPKNGKLNRICLQFSFVNLQLLNSTLEVRFFFDLYPPLTNVKGLTSSQSRGTGRETRTWTEMESTSLAHHDPVFSTTATLGIIVLLTWGTKIREENPDYLARNIEEDINWKKKSLKWKIKKKNKKRKMNNFILKSL